MTNLPSIQHFNQNAVAFTVGDRTWYWSYNTCVAYRGKNDLVSYQVRRNRDFSPTTERHLGYMGVADWPRVDDETFERLATGGPTP